MTNRNNPYRRELPVPRGGAAPSGTPDNPAITGFTITTITAIAPPDQYGMVTVEIDVGNGQTFTQTIPALLYDLITAVSLSYVDTSGALSIGVDRLGKTEVGHAITLPFISELEGGKVTSGDFRLTVDRYGDSALTLDFPLKDMFNGVTAAKDSSGNFTLTFDRYGDIDKLATVPLAELVNRIVGHAETSGDYTITYGRYGDADASFTIPGGHFNGVTGGRFQWHASVNDQDFGKLLLVLERSGDADDINITSDAAPFSRITGFDTHDDDSGTDNTLKFRNLRIRSQRGDDEDDTEMPLGNLVLGDPGTVVSARALYGKAMLPDNWYYGDQNATNRFGPNVTDASNNYRFHCIPYYIPWPHKMDRLYVELTDGPSNDSHGTSYLNIVAYSYDRGTLLAWWQGALGGNTHRSFPAIFQLNRQATSSHKSFVFTPGMYFFCFQWISASNSNTHQGRINTGWIKPAWRNGNDKAQSGKLNGAGSIELRFSSGRPPSTMGDFLLLENNDDYDMPVYPLAYGSQGLAGAGIEGYRDPVEIGNQGLVGATLSQIKRIARLGRG